MADSKSVKALRKLALGFPDATEGIACKGTPLEKSTFKVRSKSFLFLGGDAGSYNAMVKLDGSLAEAKKLAAKEPHRYKAGASGWTTATLPHDDARALARVEKWIGESFELMAPKPKPKR